MTHHARQSVWRVSRATITPNQTKTNTPKKKAFKYNTHVQNRARSLFDSFIVAMHDQHRLPGTCVSSDKYLTPAKIK